MKTDSEKRLDWIESMIRSTEDDAPRAMTLALIEIARTLERIANRLEFADLDAPPREPETGTFPLVDEEQKKSK